MIQSSGGCPQHFYKYKHIDEKQLKHSSRIFTENELYFCTAPAFNDPFDCKFGVDFSGPEKEMIQSVHLVLENQNPSLSKKERHEIVCREMEPLDRPAIAKNVKKGINEKIEKYGICCLSEVKDDILMWAHYADAHHGFCLEFLNELDLFVDASLKSAGPLKQIRWPVEYSNKYPLVKLVQDSPETSVKKTIFTKAEPWKYEKEWRIVTLMGPGPYQFQPQFLTGVIFGCRMSVEHKGMIRYWCKDRQPAIKFYEAQLSDDSYSLKIVPAS